MGLATVLRSIGGLLSLGATLGLALTLAQFGPFDRFGSLSQGFLFLFYGLPFVAGILLVFAAGSGGAQRARVKLEPTPHHFAKLKPRRTEEHAMPSASASSESVDAQEVTERDLLLEKKDEIQTKINRAKVQYGLGQLSATAYKNYLTGLEEEKAELEARLLQLDLEGQSSGEAYGHGSYTTGK